MSLEKSTVKPGLLVSLRTTLEGNVKYVKNTIEEDHPTDDGIGRLAKWETERKIDDAVEHEEAVKVRGRCRTLITSACAKSNFGYLCAVDKQKQLEESVTEARRLAETFNNKSSLSKVGVYVLVGELVANEVEAARAINFEVRVLIDNMEQGIKKLDVQQIREAAQRAKNLGSMLTDGANEKLTDAIKSARKVATQINKQGEVAVSEIDAQTMATLASARTAFLDLEESVPVDAVFESEAPQVDFDAVVSEECLLLQLESEPPEVEFEDDEGNLKRRFLQEGPSTAQIDLD